MITLNEDRISFIGKILLVIILSSSPSFTFIDIVSMFVEIKPITFEAVCAILCFNYHKITTLALQVPTLTSCCFEFITNCCELQCVSNL